MFESIQKVVSNTVLDFPNRFLFTPQGPNTRLLHSDLLLPALVCFTLFLFPSVRINSGDLSLNN